MVQITVKQELKENFDESTRSTEIWLFFSWHVQVHIWSRTSSRTWYRDLSQMTKKHDTTPDLLLTFGSLRIGMRNIHWFASFGLPMYMHKMSNRAESRKQNWHTQTHRRPEKAFTDEKERICDYCTSMSLIREEEWKKECDRIACSMVEIAGCRMR